MFIREIFESSVHGTDKAASRNKLVGEADETSWTANSAKFGDDDGLDRGQDYRARKAREVSDLQKRLDAGRKKRDKQDSTRPSKKVAEASAHAKEVAKKRAEYEREQDKKRDAAGETYNVGNAKVTKPAKVVEATGLNKRVRIVKGSEAGKTGTVGEVRHGQYVGAPKTYTIDIDGGGSIQLPKEALRLIKSAPVTESAEGLEIGDPVIITGNVRFNGATGEIDSFGQGNRFVIVNLYNHGRHSFHSSDVSYNDYVDSDEEEARMYDRGEFRSDEAMERTPQQSSPDFAKPMFGEGSNPQDAITLDVPLLIRLLEYAREDAQSDMDLHNVAEQLIKLSSTGECLSMAQYDQIVGDVQESDSHYAGRMDVPGMASA